MEGRREGRKKGKGKEGRKEGKRKETLMAWEILRQLPRARGI